MSDSQLRGTGSVRGRRIAFGAIATLGGFAIVTQFTLLSSVISPLGAVLFCVSYFSIVSNMLVALASTAIAARPDGGIAGSKAPAAVAVYITIVCVIWSLLLRNSYAVTGLAWVADRLMHVVIPPAYVIAWAALLPKGRLRFRDAVIWLGPPLAYAVWMFARGAIDGWYPYPFLNVTAIGYSKAAIVTIVFIAIFWFVGIGYVALDRLLARRS